MTKNERIAFLEEKLVLLERRLFLVESKRAYYPYPYPQPYPIYPQWPYGYQWNQPGLVMQAHTQAQGNSSALPLLTQSTTTA